MTVKQIAQSQQQQRVNTLTRRAQSGPHVNPYGTPGMSLNGAGDFRRIVSVDESVARQVRQLALDHMKTAMGSATERTSVPPFGTIPCPFPPRSVSARPGR